MPTTNAAMPMDSGNDICSGNRRKTCNDHDTSLKTSFLSTHSTVGVPVIFRTVDSGKHRTASHGSGSSGSGTARDRPAPALANLALKSSWLE